MLELKTPSGILLRMAGGWLDEWSGGVAAQMHDDVKEVNAFGVAFYSYFEILLLKDPDNLLPCSVNFNL